MCGKIAHDALSVLCAAVFFALTSVSFGGQAPAPKKEERKKAGFNRDAPVVITSNWMEVDRKKNTITYRGRVVATQADMTLKSERVVAHYSPDMKQLREVVAEGNVEVTQGDRVATGTRAVFNGAAQTITLTGNAKVKQGESEVSGARIILFIDEDRAVAEGGIQERVKATIYPGDFEGREKAGSGSKR